MPSCACCCADAAAEVLASHASSMRWATQELQEMQQAAAGSSSSSSAAAAAGPTVAARLRISQLDALALDAELGWMLSAQLRRACKFLPAQVGASDAKAEWEL